MDNRSVLQKQLETNVTKNLNGLDDVDADYLNKTLPDSFEEGV